ncbi:MAG TPA: methyltransferase domain-containing protein [Nocardioidaceae bacterium]|nr:methyltransferase domain-containing protein [Nocardioidaceae bacterium]
MTDDERMLETRRLAAHSRDAADPTAWFEQLYSAASDGTATVPWDRGGPHPMLASWVAANEPGGSGRRALVVGCGLGDDAELIGSLGFDTIAFDISPTAVATTQGRYPSSPVSYVVRSLFELPTEWIGAFDFVFESQTVQSIPVAMRSAATAAVQSAVAPGGELLVIAAAREPDEPDDGPPWPLTRAEIDAFAGMGLQAVGVEHLVGPAGPTTWVWRARFERQPVE